MRSVSEEVKERVRRGAALLDDKEPGWRDRISPAELDMSDCSMCVVGQVRGLSVFTALLAYWETLAKWNVFEQALYGFSIHDKDGRGVCTRDELRDAWIGFIKEEWS